MAKYRLLTTEELKLFEKEFIDFLVVNGIISDSWEKMKIENIEEADKIIDLFSDIIFEKILRQNSYLEQKLKSQLFCFYFGKKKAELMLINYTGDSDISEMSYDEIIEDANNTSGMFKINYQTKAYSTTREKEMFDLIQTGCEITDGDIFKKLKAYYIKQSN
ncbi:MAG: hypothetical protein HKO66_15395 [Saprospiraceae bacterium]|nr:hypothetical protein [Bacteroidia bacterium]NNE15107.1 hypothetical protein [Saprospiraceae bacterium]NNL93625.1 hypothetical protein [Saprospiraceae bacterium]